MPIILLANFCCAGTVPLFTTSILEHLLFLMTVFHWDLRWPQFLEHIDSGNAWLREDSTVLSAPLSRGFHAVNFTMESLPPWRSPSACHFRLWESSASPSSSLLSAFSKPPSLMRKTIPGVSSGGRLSLQDPLLAFPLLPCVALSHDLIILVRILLFIQSSLVWENNFHTPHFSKTSKCLYPLNMLVLLGIEPRAWARRAKTLPLSYISSKLTFLIGSWPNPSMWIWEKR